MRAHIGIVACSAEGAALCYRSIVHYGGEHLGTYAHPEVSLHSHSLAEYVVALERGDWDRVADLMLSSAHKLAAAGADFLICPDNTIHGAFPKVARASPLPWLHIAEIVARRAQAAGFRRVGLLGTRFTMEGEVYPQKLGELGLDYRRPSASEIDTLHRIVFEELVKSVFTAESLAVFQKVMKRLADEEGCDAMVLGCTEIPLLVPPDRSPLPTLDSTRLLAQAAVDHALGRDVPGRPHEVLP
ncbi:MAG TPA: amino acid racemase [Anaeromyxobacteraceae bacterium]|nr:amino acid racemase [Anaeromyxobacteraceae bacterium]